MLQTFGKRRICNLFNPLFRQNLIILHFSTILNKSQLAPSSERFDKSGDPHKNAYNSGTLGATSKCRTYLESWEQMQFHDARKTVVAFVVLPEFAFKVRRFFRDQL